MSDTQNGTRVPPPGRRVRFVRWLRRTVLLSALGTLGWYAWGGLEAARFNARVDELRTSGALRTLDELVVPPGPSAENGFVFLRDAQVEAFTRAIELRTEARLRGFEPGDRFIPYAQWDQSQLDHLGKMLEDMAPLTAAIDRALACPRIVAFSEREADPGASMEAHWVLRTCQETAAAHPSRRPAEVERMLRFMDRWQTQPGLLSGRVALWQSLVLPELARALGSREGGATFGETWIQLLAAEESHLVAMPAALEAFERAALYRVVAGWQRGEDPMGEQRELLSSIDGHLDETELDGKAAELEEQVDGIMRRMRDGILQRPPHPSWWEWPLLQHTTRELADQLPDEPIRPWTLAEMRSVARGDPVRGIGADMTRQVQMILQRLAALRAARVAIRVHTLLRERDVDEVEIETLRLGIDVLSEQPFVMTREGDTVLVSVPPSRTHDALREALGDDPHSRWRVRMP